jgi:hypothetical protein
MAKFQSRFSRAVLDAHSPGIAPARGEAAARLPGLREPEAAGRWERHWNRRQS